MFGAERHLLVGKMSRGIKSKVIDWYLNEHNHKFTHKITQIRSHERIEHELGIGISSEYVNEFNFNISAHWEHFMRKMRLDVQVCI